MAKTSDTAFLSVFAGALELTGLWLLSKPGLDLPTRRPPQVIHLEGLSQLLFAGGPMLAGVTLALAAWRLHRGGELGPDTVTPLETGCFLAGIACLILGIFSGHRP